MTSLSLSQFDQANLLFFLFAAVGLIRERRVLPFLIVVLGSVFIGSVSAVMLAGLILWNLMDSGKSKWVQLKDSFGFLLIVMGSVLPSPYQEFGIFLGACFVSLSFGKGGLGVIPPLLLLRQYVPHPEPIEPIFIGAGAFWLMVEIVAWAKVESAGAMIAIFEVLASLAILSGFKEIASKVLDDSNLLILSSAILFFIIVLFSWIKWKGDGFWSFYQNTKSSLVRWMVFGKRFVTDVEFWPTELQEPKYPEIALVFNHLFWLVLGTLSVLLGFVLFSRGGFN